MINNLKAQVRRMSARTGSTWRALVAVAFAGLLTAACDVHGVTAPGSLAKIVVTPNATVVALASQQMIAVGYDAEDRVIPITPTWSVAASGGTINTTGGFAAGSTPGVFANTVVATVGTIKGNATITVTAGAMATITVTPTPATVAVNGVQQFTAVGKDISGNVVSFIPTWSVVAGGGSVDAAGLFTAGTVAATFANTVQASNNNLKGLATVTVTPGALASITVSPTTATLSINSTQAYTAVGKDANGNVVAITPTWSVVAGGGAISTAGLFTAGTVPGIFAATVKATSGTISGTAGATVTSGALASITVTPNPAAVAIGGAQQFVAAGFDASGNSVAVTPTWSVVAGGGSITSTGGLFTAGTTPGTFTNTVTATSGSISGTATVVVGTGTLATITVTPNPGTLAVGGTLGFTAVGRDIAGNTVTITPVWSATTGGAINSGTGVFTAGSTPGTYINSIKATVGTVNGTSTVTVTAGPLATITVTPNPANINTGAAMQFTAVGKDASGNVITITPTWSANATAGTVSLTGLFTAGTTAGTYNTGVTATSGLIAGSAQIIETAVVTVVNRLGRASVNGIFAGTAVTCVTGAIINADVAISAGSTINGPCAISGTQHLGDGVAANEKLDLISAHDSLFALPCSASNTVGTTNLGGTTKTAGVWCSASSLGVTGTLTLDGGGDPNATFVFQAGTALTTAGNIVLINGAKANNVFWVLGSDATLGTASHFQGNILALNAITINDNSTLIGRALARNSAVTLGTNGFIALP